MVALHRLDGVAVLQLLGFQSGDGCVVFDHEVLHRCLEQVDASLPSTFRSFSWYASSCRSSSSCDLVLLLKLEAVVEGLVVLKLHSSVFSKSLCLLFLAVFGLLPSGWLLKLHYLSASTNLLIGSLHLHHFFPDLPVVRHCAVVRAERERERIYFV